MASYLAIAAVGKTILRVLEDACPQTEFPQAKFSLYAANEFQSASEFQSPGALGITLFLYRVATNLSRRNTGPRVDLSNHTFRPSLCLDLFYLLTPWASSAEQQQRMLGWAMRTLDNVPQLTANLLNQVSPEPNIFGDHEDVELIFDPLSLQDIALLWDHLKQSRIMPSATYLARIVCLESQVPMVEGRYVQTREFDLAKGP